MRARARKDAKEDQGLLSAWLVAQNWGNSGAKGDGGAKVAPTFNRKTNADESQIVKI